MCGKKALHKLVIEQPAKWSSLDRNIIFNVPPIRYYEIYKVGIVIISESERDSVERQKRSNKVRKKNLKWKMYRYNIAYLFFFLICFMRSMFKKKVESMAPLNCSLLECESINWTRRNWYGDKVKWQKQIFGVTNFLGSGTIMHWIWLCFDFLLGLKFCTQMANNASKWKLNPRNRHISVADQRFEWWYSCRKSDWSMDCGKNCRKFYFLAFATEPLFSR